MADFSWLDLAAVLLFAAAWGGYHLAVEVTPAGRRSLNRVMDEHRAAWMRQLVLRENRIVDTTIMASLQNGTAFYASTSLIAIGGVLALFRATDSVLQLYADAPLGVGMTRVAFEAKVLGLAVIFVYAFFKFAWAHRLFNYNAILIGAVPAARHAGESETSRAVDRAAAMNRVAGRHFNRGQRAYFFALAYLGWFLGAPVFMAATVGILYVMWRRQFASDALDALEEPSTP